MSNINFVQTGKVTGLRRDFFRHCLTGAVQVLGLTETIGLSINLVSNARLRALNRRYRDKDQTTDVLSFPLLSAKQIAKLRAKGAIIELGDIFINLPLARRQARLAGVNLEQPLAGLLIHGLLHLLGYDHTASSQQANKMRVWEKRILTRINPRV